MNNENMNNLNNDIQNNNQSTQETFNQNQSNYVPPINQPPISNFEPPKPSEKKPNLVVIGIVAVVVVAGLIFGATTLFGGENGTRGQSSSGSSKKSAVQVEGWEFGKWPLLDPIMRDGISVARIMIYPGMSLQELLDAETIKVEHNYDEFAKEWEERREGATSVINSIQHVDITHAGGTVLASDFFASMNIFLTKRGNDFVVTGFCTGVTGLHADRAEIILPGNIALGKSGLLDEASTPDEVHNILGEPTYFRGGFNTRTRYGDEEKSYIQFNYQSSGSTVDGEWISFDRANTFMVIWSIK